MPQLRSLNLSSLAARVPSWLSALFLRLKPSSARLELYLYCVWAAFCTLWVAHQFFSSLHFQLFLAESRGGFTTLEQPWSAPLDDVFIHFDFARSAARGHLFEWSEGNGYSSGGTSLLYPLFLSVGYRLGYQAENLMLWAGILACLCVFSTLLAGRVLFQQLPRFCSWLLPPALLATGVLDWSLFSGMEVALLLAVWALCARAWWRLYNSPADAKLWPNALSLGLWCAVLTATRPEAAVIVACFVLSALGAQVSRRRPGTLFAALCLSAGPGALVIVVHTVANRVLTGDFSAAGALVKLEVNHPYLTREQVIDAWWFHFKYQILRVTNYHFSTLFIPVPGLNAVTKFVTESWPALGLQPSAEMSTGWAAWLLAALGLADRRTRAASLLLWACILTLISVVAFNGQVRWQNERYAMPAVAWLLINAALGLALCGCWLTELGARLRARARPNFALCRRGALAALGSLLAVLFVVGQHDAFTGQRWFFGRASRNIWDQHVRVANGIKRAKQPPSRVLVGDAGAIPYVSDLPALDIIGLGGYKDLPFARATRHGVAAGLELIERMPATERPDLMAIYPGWWGELPLWFGRELWAVGVRGNVICGGANKVVYQPNWDPFIGSQAPTALTRREEVCAELDLGDVVSERQAGMKINAAPGYVTMKMLPFPGTRSRDLWDAGRILPQGSSIDFTLTAAKVHEPLQLVLRTAPPQAVALEVSVNQQPVGKLELAAGDRWQEPSVLLPAHVVEPSLQVQVNVTHGELILYHLWAVQQ